MEFPLFKGEILSVSSNIFMKHLQLAETWKLSFLIVHFFAIADADRFFKTLVLPSFLLL